MGRALTATATCRSGTPPPATTGPPAPPLPGDTDVRRRGRRAPGSPGCGPPTTCSGDDPRLRVRRARGGDRRVRRLRPQRRLVLRAVPEVRRPAGRRCPGADRAGALALHAAMRATVDEVGRVAAAEGIDAHFAKGGTVARRPHAGPARAGPRGGRRTPAPWGRGADELRLLDADEARGDGRRRRARSARPSPRTARRSTRPGWCAGWPGRSSGAAAHPRAAPGRRDPTRPRCVTEHGTVRADVVVRATEGYTAAARRATGAPSCPVYSLMVATEPLTDDAVGPRSGSPAGRRSASTATSSSTASAPPTAGWRSAAAGRRTTSARRCAPGYDRDERVWAGAAGDAARPVPGARATSGSPTPGAARSGIPRDWCASVGLDRATGLAWAGGYVGDGVSTTNLAGRTLRDLVLGRGTELTALPWVQHRSPPLGARAAALAGHQRRAARDERSPTARSGSPAGPSRHRPRPWPRCIGGH